MYRGFDMTVERTTDRQRQTSLIWSLVRTTNIHESDMSANMFHMLYTYVYKHYTEHITVHASRISLEIDELKKS